MSLQWNPVQENEPTAGPRLVSQMTISSYRRKMKVVYHLHGQNGRFTVWTTFDLTDDDLNLI